MLESLQKPFKTEKFPSMLSPFHAAKPGTGCKQWQNITPLYSVQKVKPALDQHQLVQHYQPKIEMATGKLISVESLVRLQISP